MSFGLARKREVVVEEVSQPRLGFFGTRPVLRPVVTQRVVAAPREVVVQRPAREVVYVERESSPARELTGLFSLAVATSLLAGALPRNP